MFKKQLFPLQKKDNKQWKQGDAKIYLFTYILFHVDNLKLTIKI